MFKSFHGGNTTRQFSIDVKRPKFLISTSLITGSLALINILTIGVIGRGLLGSVHSANAATQSPNSPQTLAMAISDGTNYIATDTLGDDNVDGSINLIPTRDISNNGITSGRHYVTISTNAVNGYTVRVTTSTSNTNLVDERDRAKIIRTISGSEYTIMPNNTWGYAPSGFNGTNDVATSECTTGGNTIENADKGTPTKFLPVLGNDNMAYAPYISNRTCPTSSYGNTVAIYYAIRIDDLSTIPYGAYGNTVVYTAITEPVASPAVTSVTPNVYQLGNTDTNADRITITGTNLASTYQVYIDLNSNGTLDANESCTSLTPDGTSPNTTLTCILPTSGVSAGTYNLYLTTQGGTAEQNEATKITYEEAPTVCNTTSGEVYDSSMNVCVDYDENMIPVKYTGDKTNGGSGWVKADPTNTNNDWFNYSDTAKGNAVAKQWANAVTVADPATYKSADPGTAILMDDIKGFWVYIPRYDYYVKRFNATDTVVQAQNFQIQFKTTKDTKNIPTGNNQWATHPAFTWGNKGLNGIWMGKFEITGSRTAPTILPSKISNTVEHIGTLYSIAKSIGVEDPDNTYGGSTGGPGHPLYGAGGNLSADPIYNQHNLARSPTHMIKNSEWGAAAYLSASIYGAGVNRVQSNLIWPGYGSNSWNTNILDDDGQSLHYGVTGCGPNTAGSTSSIQYKNWTASNPCYSQNNTYDGTIGRLASTTNNVYGIYDMAGGGYDYVMGNRTNNAFATSPNSNHMLNAPTGKYVDLYRSDITPNFGTKPSWASSTNEEFYNYSVCTWSTCGGHALHETLNVQSVTQNTQSWGGDQSSFASSSYPWVARGMHSGNSSAAGVFASYRVAGSADASGATRPILVPTR